MIKNERLEELFDELVPISGPASNMAGELVRAVSRIGYRFYNDGDHIGVGYGNETCNAAGRYLSACGDDGIDRIVLQMYGLRDEAEYERLLGELVDSVVAYVDAYPALRETPTRDLWSFEVPEDYDYEEEEDW